MSVTKKIALASFLLFVFLYGDFVKAQTAAFIHIQSENNNAFSIQWKNNTYTSSTSGYLVIPQVPAGEQVLIFNFQDTSLPAYIFSVTMEDKPRGFTLKQSISNNWSLFDMVSFAVTKGTERPKPKEEKPVLVISKYIEPEKKPAPEPKDTAAKPVSAPITVVNIEKTQVNKLPKSNEPPIQKIFDKANTSGIDQVYIVISKGKADTIAVFIPALKEETPRQFAFKLGKGHRKSQQSPPITDWVYIDRIKPSFK